MAEVQQMVELLGGMSCVEKEKRSLATKMYKEAKEKNPEQMIVTLMKVVECAQATQDNKKSALLYLRKQLNKHDGEFIFSKLADPIKKEIAHGLLMFFENATDSKIQKKIGDVITALADYVCDEEDPRGWLVQGGSCGWPELFQCMLRLANVQASPNPSCCENSFKVVTGLVSSTKGELVRQMQPIGMVLQNALQPQSPIEVKTAATLFVVEMVQYLEKKEWAALTSTVPVLITVCTELAQKGKTSELEEVVQAFIEVLNWEPDFFKSSMQSSFEPASFLSGCIKSKEASDGIRGLALEWITSYAEKKPKWLTKNCPNFPQLALECCMAMMLEIEDGEAELKEWAARMDDEEGEEDADELYSSGVEAIDRVAEALTMEVIQKALFQLIGTFSAQDAWQAKHAALSTIKQTVEYVEEREQMAEMAKLLMAHTVHPHPRVRYTALHGIGQLANDQAPQFQELCHAELMPLLMTCMDDQVDRVAAMAMSAFVSFAEELNEVLGKYAPSFMEKFLDRLTKSNHRGVQEESITAIAVIAGCVGDDFKQYYEKTMPLLKQLILSCTGEKQQRLRGKAFECLSLLGIAVGKEQFLPDAQQAIHAMLAQSTDVDDIQAEYIQQAIERICHCLKQDFAQFLPIVLPKIIKTLNIEEVAGLVPRANKGDDDDDDEIEITTHGKVVKVKTSKFEEMHQSVGLLNTFINEMEGAYYDFIQTTAQALLPVIRFDEEAAALCGDARKEAFTTWSYLVKAAREGGEAKQMQGPIPMVKELLSTILIECVPLLQKEQQDESADTDQICCYCYGLAESLGNAGPGYITQDEAGNIAQLLFSGIDLSLQRTEKVKKRLKDRDQDTPAELQGDEDDEANDPLEEEVGVRQCYEQGLGALMKANPQDFASEQTLQICGQKLQLWLSAKETQVLAWHFACDLVEQLKERSCPLWPLFMPNLFDALGNKSAKIRMGAAYAVNVVASVPAFAEAAPEAYRRIAKIVASKPPKRNDGEANCAMDNAVAALFSLARNMINQCPPDVNAFSLVLSRLPLKHDLEEAKKVHTLVCQLLQQQHGGLLGANQENVPKILSILADIYKQEENSDDKIDAQILAIFKALPQSVLSKMVGAFSEKQQARIEKILSRPQA